MMSSYPEMVNYCSGLATVIQKGIEMPQDQARDLMGSQLLDSALLLNGAVCVHPEAGGIFRAPPS